MLCIVTAYKHNTCQELCVHECTGAFFRWIFDLFLPQYTWHTLIKTDEGDCSAATDDYISTPFLLSPHHIAWPLHRPRLYSVKVLKGKCKLADFKEADGNVVSGLGRIKTLFAKPTMDCSCWCLAPQAGQHNSIKSITVSLFNSPGRQTWKKND